MAKTEEHQLAVLESLAQRAEVRGESFLGTEIGTVRSMVDDCRRLREIEAQQFDALVALHEARAIFAVAKASGDDGVSDVLALIDTAIDKAEGRS